MSRKSIVFLGLLAKKVALDHNYIFFQESIFPINKYIKLNLFLKETNENCIFSATIAIEATIPLHSNIMLTVFHYTEK